MSSYRANLETLEKMENLETKEQRWVAFSSLLCVFPFYVDAHGQSAESFAEVAGTYVKSQLHTVTVELHIWYVSRVKQENKAQWALLDLQA